MKAASKFLKRGKAEQFKLFAIRSISQKTLIEDQSKIMKRHSTVAKVDREDLSQSGAELKQSFQQQSISQAPQSHNASIVSQQEIQQKQTSISLNDEQKMIILVIDTLNELVSDKGNDKYRQLLDKVSDENVNVSLQSIVQEIKNKDEKITKLKNKTKEMQEKIEEFKAREKEELKMKELYGELNKLQNENVTLSTQLRKKATMTENSEILDKKEVQMMHQKLLELQQEKKECANLNFRLREENDNLKKEILMVRSQNSEIQHFMNETKKQMDSFLAERTAQNDAQPLGESMLENRIHHLQECLTQKELELYELRFSQIRNNQQFVTERNELNELRKVKKSQAKQLELLQQKLQEQAAGDFNEEENGLGQGVKVNKSGSKYQLEQQLSYKPLKDRKGSEECNLF